MAVLTPEVRGPTGPMPVVGGTRRRRLRHLPFGVLVALAAGLRAVAVLGYQGVLWFPDSHSYLAVAVSPRPYPARPQGYAFFLRLLEPLHSFLAVAVVQHLMGLAAGVLIYALLRGRFRAPGWVAAGCAVPVLFDGYQLELEHMLLSDTLFWFCVLVAVVLVLWRPDSWRVAAAAGLALGLAAVTRSVGLPLLAVVLAYPLLRRRWRVAGALGAACLLPVLAYAVWFHGTWGRYALTNSDGIFLYSRTAAFADCGIIHPPASERPLCPSGPPATRTNSPNYIWHVGPLGQMGNYRKFSPPVNAWAGDFARRAITTQPGAYVSTGLGDLARTFSGTREPYPTRYAVRLYDFPTRIGPLPLHVRPVPGMRLGTAVHTYTASNSDGRARIVEPYAAFMRGYQRMIYLPGPALAVILAGGAIALVVRRRTAGTALLPWACAAALLVVPPFTAAFDHRYVIPAVPLACLALGIAVGTARRAAEKPAVPVQAPRPAREPGAAR